MIDPTKITDFNRTKEQLEELLLFCIIVAGKTASIQAQKLEQFLKREKRTPFKLIQSYIKRGILLERIKEAKLGQYNRLEKAFEEVLKLNVFTCTVAELENITGIGPKTARFYILHSRANQNVAVLDTHLLKWLREELKLKAPKSTPSSKTYLFLEQKFLSFCKKNNKNPATLDLEIWNKYSAKNK
jgi:thermostable 8-oxoguanine DNA glycosylase